MSLLLKMNQSMTLPGSLLIYGSLILTTGSIFLGLYCVINRLIDFRKTAQITKIKKKFPFHPKLSSLRNETDKHGKHTWKLFRCQIICFGLGILSLVTFVVTLEILGEMKNGNA
jgi:hypothetical protein